MKVYDCFTFFNELDLLEIRLNELNDVVDYFVLVESKRSFQNKPKECHYLNNKDRFEKFNHKIIKLEVPENLFNENSWHNEKMSWNYIINGLVAANADDIIMISALDEIPQKETIKTLLENSIVPCCIMIKFYYFYLNTKYYHDFNKTEWNGPYVTKFQWLDMKNIYSFIEKRKTEKTISGGWHFSFLGNAKDAHIKVNNYGHAECNHFSEEHYKERIEKLEDPFGRNDEQKFYGLEDLCNLPKHVQENIEKFRKYLR
jgi:beta-1,4-mannosyl-glycoprotein beta-1,4-N-acetylglucosaminyltransferase